MIDALLKGLESESTEITRVFLYEKNLNYCSGCYSCWTNTPGRCVIDDDMKELIPLMNEADIIILGSPLYFCNVSGTLKVFIDRLTAAGGDPHKVRSGEPRTRSHLIMMSNCGFPNRSQFEATSAWIKSMSSMMRIELLGEFYATSGKILTIPTEKQEQKRNAYLNYLENCGKSYLERMELSEELIMQTQKDILDF
jgi:putative NADPH-quinone reductase